MLPAAAFALPREKERDEKGEGLLRARANEERERGERLSAQTWLRRVCESLDEPAAARPTASAEQCREQGLVLERETP